MERRCYIFTSGCEFALPADIAVTPRDLVVCADGGYLWAQAEGFVPHAIIGDFDSSPWPENTNLLLDAGVELLRLNPEKDETDTLACARYGMSKGCRKFVILGGLTRRFDHSLANIQTLSFLKDLECDAWIVDEDNRASMVDGVKKTPGELLHEYETARMTTNGQVENKLSAAYGVPLLLTPHENCKFSVFAYAERCVGVCIEHAKYELNDAVLTHSYPIGVSNEFLPKQAAEIRLKAGRLLVVISRDPQ